jgi:hypothetical protein
VNGAQRTPLDCAINAAVSSAGALRWPWHQQTLPLLYMLKNAEQRSQRRFGGRGAGRDHPILPIGEAQTRFESIGVQSIPIGITLKAMTMALTTRAELDQAVCPDCDGEGHEGLYLCCDKHPAALTLPFYIEGELRLECAECMNTYISIPVAG